MDDKAKRKLLLSLARKARCDIELFAKNENLCSGIDKSLVGYCGLASFYLKKIANEHGIKPTLVTGHFNEYSRIIGLFRVKSGHCWLEYQNNIIDITATQFVHSIGRIERNFNKRVYISVASNPHYTKLLTNVAAEKFAESWYDEPLIKLANRISKLNGTFRKIRTESGTMLPAL